MNLNVQKCIPHLALVIGMGEFLHRAEIRFDGVYAFRSHCGTHAYFKPYLPALSQTSHHPYDKEEFPRPVGRCPLRTLPLFSF